MDINKYKRNDNNLPIIPQSDIDKLPAKDKLVWTKSQIDKISYLRPCDIGKLRINIKYISYTEDLSFVIDKDK